MKNLLLSLIVVAALLPPVARAGTLSVTSTADDSSDGTLRNAIAVAAPGDTINFSLATPATITLTNGDLLIDKDLTILGPGAGALAVDGNAASRVFHIQGGVTAAILGLTITNGLAAGDSDFGGGIWNDHSTLTLSNCAITGNSSAGVGCGIYNDHANLTASASTFSGNSAKGFNFGGGGIYNVANSGSATVTLNACTLSGNSAGVGGGGIYNSGMFTGNATLTIATSTLSGNSAAYGGGIYNEGRAGGSATLEIGDSILNAGASGANIANDSGTVSSRGYNLSSDSGGGFLTGTAEQINTDPMLGPLQDNGGPTFTHALLPSSPAIDRGRRDAIPALALDTDQRGLPRPVDNPGIPNASGGDGSDVGAFEVQLQHADLLISCGADETNVRQGDTLTYTITVQNFGPDNAINVVANDTLSSGTTFVSAHANVGAFTTPPAGQTGVVTWYLGDLANNGQQAAQIQVTVIVRGKTSITNTATVSSDTPDPNPANNTASITTSVVNAPNGKKK